MKKTYFYNANKLQHGYVTVRDYNLKACLDSKRDLLVEHNKKTMLVPSNQISTRAQKLDQTVYPSKYGGPPYGVYHLKWVPDGEPVETESLSDEVITMQPSLM